MESGWVLPTLDDPLTQGFWEGCAKGELRVQRCVSCSETRMPPTPMCPNCRSLDNEWVTVSGQARVWSYVVAHPPLLPAFAALAPYPVVTVELVDDPSIRFVGNIVTSAEGEINEIDPTTINIGDSVHVVFAQVDDTYLPRWVPDNASN